MTRTIYKNKWIITGFCGPERSDGAPRAVFSVLSNGLTREELKGLIEDAIEMHNNYAPAPTQDQLVLKVEPNTSEEPSR